MQLPQRFSNPQLIHIIEEAVIYQCACPAEIARNLQNLREFFKYQQACQVKRSDDRGVHARIMTGVATAHAEMEACLADVLALEGWDMETLTMPAGLRALRDAAIYDDD